VPNACLLSEKAGWVTGGERRRRVGWPKERKREKGKEEMGPLGLCLGLDAAGPSVPLFLLDPVLVLNPIPF